MGDEVRLAVLEALGVTPTEPGVTPEDAARAVVGQLAAFHDEDIAAGHQDLSERLAARFGQEVLHEPHALVAMDWVLEADRGAHDAALGVFHRDLTEAFRMKRPAQ